MVLIGVVTSCANFDKECKRLKFKDFLILYHFFPYIICVRLFLSGHPTGFLPFAKSYPGIEIYF